VARSTGFICAVGTGGTLAGIGMALKKRNRDVKIGIADPMGAALYSYYTTGVLKSEGSSITEGIGHRNLEGAPIDFACQIRRGGGGVDLRPAPGRRSLPRRHPGSLARSAPAIPS
jgi:hypothetical protein